MARLLELGRCDDQALGELICFSSATDKVSRIVAYFDRERALADLGLTPDTDT
jgi:hypothetical protein